MQIGWGLICPDNKLATLVPDPRIASSPYLYTGGVGIGLPSIPVRCPFIFLFTGLEIGGVGQHSKLNPRQRLIKGTDEVYKARSGPLH